MRRLLRSPALHFLALGAALWTAKATLLAEPPDEIVIAAGDVARLRDEWRTTRGTTPAPDEEAALLAQAVDEEILHREAIARGLDRTQPIVHDRLVRLARFVAEQPQEDDEELDRAARALGLDRQDVVIRRHLVQAMRLALESLAPDDLPDDDAIAAWYAAHGDRFREPARVRLTHVYLRRGSDRDVNAFRDLAPNDAPSFDDPFLHGAHLGPLTADEVARVLGPSAAGAIDTLPIATWSGPITSPYGTHLIWVRDRIPGRIPPLDQVRSQVVHAVLAERRGERARERMAALRARWAVRIDTPG